MDYVVSVPPTTELLTLTEVKAHITPIDSSDETYINDAIKDAREYCEGKTGRALAAQTIKAYPERFQQVMRLPREPITAITSVKYTDYDDVETIMSASNYVLNEAAGTISFKVLPVFSPRIAKPIEITYTAGYTTALPRVIRRAMMILVAYWYENRGDRELPDKVEKSVLTLLGDKKVFFA